MGFLIAKQEGLNECFSLQEQQMCGGRFQEGPQGGAKLSPFPQENVTLFHSLIIFLKKELKAQLNS